MAKNVRAKKEIDKELMYKKLMPSGLRGVKTPIEDVVPENAVPQGEILGAAYEPPAGKAHHLEPRKVSVPSMDNQKTIVVNLMEAAVLNKLDDVLTRFQCCRCDRCKKDIVALALNKLPPKYKVLNHGQQVPDLDPQTNAQVITALIQAVIKVRAKPRH